MTAPASPGASGATSGTSRQSAFFFFTVGIALLLFFLVVLLTQVQTNEAFITHVGSVKLFQPDWGILLQIPDLIFGNPSSSDAMATVFGWGIEFLYLAFIAGYEHALHAAHRPGKMMGSIFRTLSWGVVGFNMWTDFNYGAIGSGFWGHLGFAVMCSFIVGFFGTVGIHFLELGWKKA